MKICGIICEFNPLHNGHQYLINEARKENDFIVCLMSGNFSQRGLPCSMDKYTRAKLAILAGADIVIELPFVYAVNSADQFAEGSIKILKELGVNNIIFGSESADTKTLEKLAEFKLHETKEFKHNLKQYLKLGNNYNQAYFSAMSDTTLDNSLKKLALSPNDILASSYIKEIKKQKAKISYKAIKRTDNGYNNDFPSDKYLSASSILKLKDCNQDYTNFVPIYTKKELASAPVFDYSKFYSILQNQIINSPEKELSKIFGYCEGLEYLIKKQIQKSYNYNQLLNNIQTKRYRMSRIQKLLLYTTLNLSNKDYKKATRQTPTINVLAVDKNQRHILSYMKSKKAKLIINYNDYKKLKKSQTISIDIDKKANNLYYICTNKNFIENKNIFIQK